VSYERKSPNKSREDSREIRAVQARRLADLYLRAADQQKTDHPSPYLVLRG
jgi:hypothetical protein